MFCVIILCKLEHINHPQEHLNSFDIKKKKDDSLGEHLRAI